MLLEIYTLDLICILSPWCFWLLALIIVLEMMVNMGRDIMQNTAIQWLYSGGLNKYSGKNIETCAGKPEFYYDSVLVV